MGLREAGGGLVDPARRLRNPSKQAIKTALSIPAEAEVETSGSLADQLEAAGMRPVVVEPTVDPPAEKPKGKRG
ncbi:MAG: hypothetical protein ACRCZI_12255 [Cetobacterium sp.]